MTSSELYSHPDRLLAQHLAEVAEAVGIIAGHHCLEPETLKRLDELVRLHDFGKATAAFQEYIRYKPSPGDWLKQRRNRPQDKVHTPLGSVASAVLKRTEVLDDDWLIQVGTSVLGHHSKLPTREDVYNSFENHLSVLERQLQGLPLEALERITSYHLAPDDFEPDEDTIFGAKESYQAAFEALDAKAVGEAVFHRLKTQLLFSILLEADKAFLALGETAREAYKIRSTKDIAPSVIDRYLKKAGSSPVNPLRREARHNALTQLSQHLDKSLFTLTLPTGLGKTLTAASLALELRRQQPRQIILVLPFLSIVDQTAKVYKDVLSNPKMSWRQLRMLRRRRNKTIFNPGADLLMQSHSLSERDYLNLEDSDASFFLDTWQSDIVVTTFDQVLLALFSSSARHQMRFHHLTDAVMIFDEVQALPSHLWDITRQAFSSLTHKLGSTVIAMSATQPGFIDNAHELIPNVSEVFKAFGRYQLVFKHQQDLPLTDFVEDVRGRYGALRYKRVLMTLNTRRSARYVYDELERTWDDSACPIYFLSADVTPKDRLKVIDKLKNNYPQPCLVVTTQVVEAGVDMDMDLVMRDFAPLDSIIQVAGRCNRNNKKPRCDVEVYSFTNPKGKRYCEFVYQSGGSTDISLQETRRVLEGRKTANEEDVLELAEQYFAAIRHHKDLGQQHTRDWAYFKEHLNVSRLLRGDQDRQYQFVVAERDEPAEGELELREALEQALAIADRWAKRRALRRLAPRMAQVTVSVWEQRNFRPENIAYQVGLSWFVREGFYDPKRGLDIAVGHPDDSSFY